MLGVAFAQETKDRPSFEVATVKASDPNPQNALLVGMAADPSIVRFHEYYAAGFVSRGGVSGEGLPDRRAGLDGERAV